MPIRVVAPQRLELRVGGSLAARGENSSPRADRFVQWFVAKVVDVPAVFHLTADACAGVLTTAKTAADGE